MVDSCPHCGGPLTRLNCPKCSKTPKQPSLPGSPPRELMALVHPRRRPSPLVGGTPKQRSFAGVVRHSLLYRLEQAGWLDARALVMCVQDPTWFISQQHNLLTRLCWPTPEQMERPAVTGACEQCGEPAYEGQPCCSEECGDARRNETLTEAERYF